MGQKVILDPGISDRLLYSARWLIWSYTNLLLHNLGLWAPSGGAGNGSVWSCQAQDPGIWGKLLGTQVPWNQSASVQTHPVGQVWHMTGHLLSSHLAFQFPAGPGTWPQTTAAWLGAWQSTNALLEHSLFSRGLELVIVPLPELLWGVLLPPWYPIQIPPPWGHLLLADVSLSRGSNYPTPLAFWFNTMET